MMSGYRGWDNRLGEHSTPYDAKKVLQNEFAKPAKLHIEKNL